MTKDELFDKFIKDATVEVAYLCQKYGKPLDIQGMYDLSLVMEKFFRERIYD